MTSNAIRIERKGCPPGNCAVYRGDTLIATIHSAKPTACNGRQTQYNVCRTSGRMDWFHNYADARNDALKG